MKRKTKILTVIFITFFVSFCVVLLNILQTREQEMKKVDYVYINNSMQADNEGSLQDIIERTPDNETHPKTFKSIKNHIFYYCWYSNIDTDGSWSHWDHTILPHWNAVIRNQHPHGIKYEPPDDIGSSFYPLRGPYSSADEKILSEHMEVLKDYVVVISWWGQSEKNGKDGEGSVTDLLMPKIFKAAEKFGTQIAIHLEPYSGRNEYTVKDDVKYILSKYGSSPSLYRDPERGNRPVFYIYDSYHTEPLSWSNILSPHGKSSIRGTHDDAIFLGIVLHEHELETIKKGYFDGFYTYFAADGFTQCSTSSNWKKLTEKAKKLNLISCISVGPGYDDLRVRPWNQANVKPRANGKYYDNMWSTAINSNPTWISVTSFNEWMEGTQIEEAIPKVTSHSVISKQSYKYVDYSPLPENYYLTATNQWSKKW